jgi:hypothetical protein
MSYGDNVTLSNFPPYLVRRPIFIDIRPGWVAIITTDCDASFPNQITILRDEPNFTLSGAVCRIEMVQIAQEQIVNIPDFGRRCPTRQSHGGDQEFAGNGPSIYCRSTVLLQPPNLNLATNFIAAEIGGDSYVEDTWTQTIFTIPEGMRVLGFDRTLSETVGNQPVTHNLFLRGFRSRAAGPEPLPFVCNEGQVHLNGQDFQLRGDLVREMEIVGDTGYQDINTGNCGCDTGIRNIKFNPVRVYLGRI